MMRINTYIFTNFAGVSRQYYLARTVNKRIERLDAEITRLQDENKSTLSELAEQIEQNHKARETYAGLWAKVTEITRLQDELKKLAEAIEGNHKDCTDFSDVYECWCCKCNVHTDNHLVGCPVSIARALAPDTGEGDGK